MKTRRRRERKCRRIEMAKIDPRSNEKICNDVIVRIAKFQDFSLRTEVQIIKGNKRFEMYPLP
jgi:uncharacterized protein YijF (DUF1287 family)